MISFKFRNRDEEASDGEELLAVSNERAGACSIDDTLNVVASATVCRCCGRASVLAVANDCAGDGSVDGAVNDCAAAIVAVAVASVAV